MRHYLRTYFILFACCMIVTILFARDITLTENALAPAANRGALSQHGAAAALPGEAGDMNQTMDCLKNSGNSGLSKQNPLASFSNTPEWKLETEPQQPAEILTPDTTLNPRQKEDLTIAMNLSLSSLFIFDVNGVLAPCLADPDFKVFYDEPVPEEMKVYLTFDDGPSEYTADILDALDQYGAVATFFMLEPHIRLYPEIVQRAFKEGHALGSHGVTHKYRKFYQSTESIISEIDQTIAAIRDATAVGSPLVRLPYGTVPNVSKKQLAILNEHGYKIWDWNVDSCDWKMQDGRYVNTTIKQLQKLRENETAPVILLHDMKGTAAHLPDLLKYLYDNGYVFCTIDPSLPELRLGS